MAEQRRLRYGTNIPWLPLNGGKSDRRTERLESREQSSGNRFRGESYYFIEWLDPVLQEPCSHGRRRLTASRADSVRLGTSWITEESDAGEGSTKFRYAGPDLAC